MKNSDIPNIYITSKVSDVLDSLSESKISEIDALTRSVIVHVTCFNDVVELTLQNLKKNSDYPTVFLTDLDGTLTTKTGTILSAVPFFNNRLRFKQIFDENALRINELSKVIPVAITTDRDFNTEKHKFYNSQNILQMIKENFQDVRLFHSLSRETMGNFGLINYSDLTDFICKGFSKKFGMTANPNLIVFFAYDSNSMLSRIDDLVGGEGQFFKRVIPEVRNSCPNIKNIDLILYAVDR